MRQMLKPRECGCNSKSKKSQKEARIPGRPYKTKRLLLTDRRQRTSISGTEIVMTTNVPKVREREREGDKQRERDRGCVTISYLTR